MITDSISLLVVWYKLETYWGASVVEIGLYVKNNGVFWKDLSFLTPTNNLMLFDVQKM